jgi:serine/threonine protein kinase
MSLASGTKLGPYEILTALGAGGMGEVYRARDTRLERTVAIKVLAHDVKDRAELFQRFEREAHTISTLNHPNICTLHDIGTQEGLPYLVMEYVEGETLSKRLMRGPLPLDQVWSIAIQVGEALDQAHRHGIVHRDLKPGNVMLAGAKGSTIVKLLDFGLAKISGAARSAAAPASLTSLPTETVDQGLTVEGTIVGTLQYMSPEQLEGAEADARSDIFAFGCVLYEMITGQQAFRGKSKATLISAILTSEPQPVAAVQPTTPPALDRLVRKCLAKNPEDRWQTARDLVSELRWISESSSQSGAPTPVAVRRKYLKWTAWAVSAASVLALSAITWIHFSEARSTLSPVKFEVPAPRGTQFSDITVPAVSPDGSKLVFTTHTKGESKLWLRPMNSTEPRELPSVGTDVSMPFWSPDSRFVGIFSDGKLFKIDTAGGPAVTLCAAFGNGGTWNRDGVILIGGSVTDPPLRRVSASSGDLKIALELNAALHEARLGRPVFLPDGRHFLYFSLTQDRGTVRLGSLDSTETFPLMLPAGASTYASSPGYLLFARQGTLFAQRFDDRKFRLLGEAAPVAEGVGVTGRLTFSSSQNGVLAYRGGSGSQLAWYYRSGKRVPVPLSVQYRQAALSPDGRRVVLERFDPLTTNYGIWLLDLGSGILSPFTGSKASNTDPVWSPDGTQVAFGSNRRGHVDIFRQAVGSSEAEAVWVDAERKVPEAWLKDGTLLFATEEGKNYYQVSQDGKSPPKRLYHSDFLTDEAMVSPDGRLVAFNSLQSGRWEVYVAKFPEFTNTRQVSRDGGSQGRWRADSKELYFLDASGRMMAVGVNPGSALEIGAPLPLFQTAVRVNPVYDQYGVTADGNRFLVIDTVYEPDKPITVILNWPELLRR